ncbi:toxin ParE1/3/4 [Chryseobacterium taeanense]|uniref:Toxin n=1 Tax=Chryseobacterium taeanense TaxID=311334 RepID=A0A1G8DP31_9FLAO|nr:type II toxin-antitoxin system RelE/ParE family toxin [Chryseobacterium taeanense]SDH59407.1 toxin ParE1/3/4 [Chryseobacterium taeanense]
MSENTYILSEAADQDLENIFDFTLNQFGFDQAEKYLLEIEDVFKILVLHPESGKARNEVKEGLYSFPKDNHIIFYRILDKQIQIIRVLHGSRDLPNYF